MLLQYCYLRLAPRIDTSNSAVLSAIRNSKMLKNTDIVFFIL